MSNVLYEWRQPLVGCGRETIIRSRFIGSRSENPNGLKNHVTDPVQRRSPYSGIAFLSSFGEKHERQDVFTPRGAISAKAMAGGSTRAGDLPFPAACARRGRRA